MTLQIYRLIKSRGLKQAEAGKILGIKQPHVSALMRNRAGSFSVERLMDFLTAHGQNVEITVKPARKKQGEISLVACDGLREWQVDRNSKELCKSVEKLVNGHNSLDQGRSGRPGAPVDGLAWASEGFWPLRGWLILPAPNGGTRGLG